MGGSDLHENDVRWCIEGKHFHDGVRVGVVMPRSYEARGVLTRGEAVRAQASGGM